MIEIISCIGLHWILKYGTILNIPRRFICKVKIIADLFKCSLCLGFWVGVLGTWVSGNVYLPFASAGACWFVDNVNNTIQSIEIKLDKQD
jgi:hypothetical protein